VYDYLGNRVRKTANGTESIYLYNGEDIVKEATGGIDTNYLHGIGIDEPVMMDRAGAEYYYFRDGLGSIREMTDSGGTVQDSHNYGAWGEVRNQTQVLNNIYGYTGREFSEDGLYFYRARYLEPNLGRFISEDPLDLMRIKLIGNNLKYNILNNFIFRSELGNIQFLDESLIFLMFQYALHDPELLKAYLYVGNDPINKIDPTGEIGVVSILVVLGVGVSAFYLYKCDYWLTKLDKLKNKLVKKYPCDTQKRAKEFIQSKELKKALKWCADFIVQMYIPPWVPVK